MNVISMQAFRDRRNEEARRVKESELRKADELATAEIEELEAHLVAAYHAAAEHCDDASLARLRSALRTAFLTARFAGRRSASGEG